MRSERIRRIVPSITPALEAVNAPHAEVFELRGAMVVVRECPEHHAHISRSLD